jgi:broad specificity phosphatase PhoE
MAQRLLVVAHAPTSTTKASVFGDPGELVRWEEFRRLSERIASWVCGPEKVCQATALRLGGTAEVIDGLRECDFAAWRGKALAEVASQDPSGVDTWLRDPHAAPHGGESLAVLINRVGRVLDDQQWSDGRSVAVVTPLVAQALLVHALGAPPGVIFRIDIAPLGRILISRSNRDWRLQELSATPKSH